MTWWCECFHSVLHIYCLFGHFVFVPDSYASNLFLIFFKTKLLTCLQSSFYSFPWYFSKTVSDTIKYNSVCQYMTGWNCLAAIPQSVTGMLSVCFSMITTASTVWKLQFWTQSIFQTIQTHKQDMKAKACCWMMLHLVAVYMLRHAITGTAWWDGSSLIVAQWSQSTPQPINPDWETTPPTDSLHRVMKHCL